MIRENFFIYLYLPVSGTEPYKKDGTVLSRSVNPDCYNKIFLFYIILLYSPVFAEFRFPRARKE